MALVKIEDVYINPAQVVSIEDSAIVGVTHIKMEDGTRYATTLSPDTIARRLNKRKGRC